MSTALVVDASVVVKWFFPEEGSAAATAVLASGADLFAPDLLFAEAANTVWKRLRRGEIEPAQARGLAADLEAIAVEAVACRSLAAEAVALAAGLDHSVYDCCYLVLALRLDCALITADGAFAAKVRGERALRTHVRPLAEWG